MASFDREIDVSGLHCPMPILRAKKVLAGIASGEVLHVIATNLASANDIPSFVKQAGDELVEARREGDTYHYFLGKV